MNANKKDLLPEYFDSAEEAGEFWDTHSVADYWEDTTEVDLEFNLQRRVFLIPIANPIYYRLKNQPQQLGQNFYAIFDMTENENLLHGLDLPSVSLIPIQENMYQLVQEQQKELANYKKLLLSLAARVDELEKVAL